MKRLLRENGVNTLLAGIGVLALAHLGLSLYPNDYINEAQPAFSALAHGHLQEFLRLAPAYGGSLVERAPLALLPGLWGGGRLAVFRSVALPGAIAAAVLGVWLLARMRELRRSGTQTTGPAAGLLGAGDGLLARALVLILCAANPLALAAFEYGHPEEILGAVLCVGAVLLAASGRPGWAGLLLGLAIANKQWAVVATGPVLLAIPSDAPAAGKAPRAERRRRGTATADDSAGSTAASSAFRAWPARLSSVARGRLLCLLSAGTTAALIFAPLLLVPGSSFVAAGRGIASTSSTIFEPWSVWWFLGHHYLHVTPKPHMSWPKLVALYLSKLRPGYREAPEWVGHASHPSIILAGALLPALAWRMRRRDTPGEQLEPTGRLNSAGLRRSLLLLSLLLLLRCLLDTWDFFYYLLPFALAVLVWEVHDAPRRPPLLAFAATALTWATFRWVRPMASPDLQSVLFLAWTIPLAGFLALRLFGPDRPVELLRRFRAARGEAAELPRAVRPQRVGFWPCPERAREDSAGTRSSRLRLH